MNLGFNLPKSPYGPFFWLFIIATLVLIIAVNVGRYQNPLEEPIGISSRLAPKNLESTFLNFIVLLLYGLSVASYQLYWKKYVHSKLPLICLNFLIKLYQLQLTTKSTWGLPCMAYPICLPNNSTHDCNMHNCDQNCMESWQITSKRIHA